MGLILRSTKGSALTIDELDGNFLYLTSAPAVTGSFAVCSNPGQISMEITGSNVLFPKMSSSLYFTDDTTAAAGGVPLGGMYLNWDGAPNTSAFLTIRLV
jgi:hypothetical protein